MRQNIAFSLIMCCSFHSVQFLPPHSPSHLTTHLTLPSPTSPNHPSHSPLSHLTLNTHLTLLSPNHDHPPHSPPPTSHNHPTHSLPSSSSFPSPHSSEAVCTPFATSIISDYFKEVSGCVLCVSSFGQIANHIPLKIHWNPSTRTPLK